MRIALIIFFFIPIASPGQFRGSNWAISDSILIHFSTSGNTVTNSVLHCTYDNLRDYVEPMATISDDSGKMLFYTDGFTIWNKDDDVIANGDSLQCNNSITNGVIIVPYPGHDSLYYVFYLKDIATGLSYAVVNANGNNGNESVIEKNIPLLSDTELTEKLTAVKHSNGRDWWIIVHNMPGNDFCKFLVTQDRIYGPFWQKIGTIQNVDGTGEICFSSKGERLGMVSFGDAEVFNFDRCTGELSNDLSLDPLFYESDYYGCSFSPDGTKFYASTLDFRDNSSNIYQFDLNNIKPASTKTLIWHDPYPDLNIHGDSLYFVSQQELGPDNKIYISMVYGYWPSTTNYAFPDLNLSVINNPNGLGASCDFQPCSFYLNGHRTTSGLPNMPNYNLSALFSAGLIEASKDNFCVGGGISLLSSKGTAGALQWQASIDSIHFANLTGDTLTTYSTPSNLNQTTYYRLTAGSGDCMDSSNVVAVHILPSPIANFIDSISGKQVFFNSKGSSNNIISYSWDFGDNSTSTLANPSHTYAGTSDTFNVCLTVYNGSNCSYTKCNRINLLTSIISIPSSASLLLHPNPAQDELTVEVLNNLTPKQLIITDDLGRTVLQKNFINSSTQLYVRLFPVSVYFIKVQMSDGNIAVRKFVKE